MEMVQSRETRELGEEVRAEHYYLVAYSHLINLLSTYFTVDFREIIKRSNEYHAAFGIGTCSC